MRFTNRKRHNPPTVIIVSLIDILIVLLIFLMVSTTFKDIPALRITLPETKQAAPKEVTTEVQPLIVTITTNAPYLYLGRLAVTYNQLQAELIDRAKKNPGLVLAIRADRQATLDNLVRVKDAAYVAQVKETKLFLQSGIKP